ncbi:hypothetical protein EBM89_11055 [Cellulomonas triticagri]|uniref:Uncharacterized protein n=1 Tax=Cellulomonas triticagri TaxID=2483352 RepID=A0A3M2JEB3_9CELL|nr:hypothetical protein EBM89_11055 [Cellulomonas triticagri]
MGRVRVRQRVMSVLVLVGCLGGIVAVPLGWGAHEPARFCRTAAACPDLRWPSADPTRAAGPGQGADVLVP